MTWLDVIYALLRLRPQGDSETVLAWGPRSGLHFGDGVARTVNLLISPDSYFHIPSEVKSLVSVCENDYQPEPLTVEIQIQLIQWRSTEEALRGLVM